MGPAVSAPDGGDARDARAGIPGSYALEVVRLAARWHVPAEALLDGLGVTVAALAEPATRLSVSGFRTLFQRAVARTGEPGLGCCMGMQMRLASHGFLGFAAMTSGTVREALALAERFAATRIPALALRPEVVGDTVSLTLEEREPLGDLREYVVTALFVGLAQIGAAITGRAVRGGADVTFAEPAYFPRFAHLIPGEVRFERPSNRLVFPAELLDWPLVDADPAAAQLARAQCERELDRLGDLGGVVARVRRALPHDHDAGFRSVVEVAKALHVSPRTLKRQLATSGTTFQAVLDDLRRDRALVLLDRAELTLDEVADRLGYSDTANFTRAFKRWTGQTPAVVRRR
ncbi:MAG: AraC family transcriptional regulator [Deltaproteobacteria bacterium]|nr:AraC family transcriptional regulator [Deltaproteobacteria bacterium]